MCPQHEQVFEEGYHQVKEYCAALCNLGIPGNEIRGILSDTIRWHGYEIEIVGNKNIRATFSKRGELLRVYYPNVDFKQFIDFFHVGVKINDSAIIYLHADINNRYDQYY